jgi:SsrA-binding protein
MYYFAQNKKVYHDYAILETFSAGIVLTGNEVKSIKKNQANLTGCYALIIDNELKLLNCYIAHYQQAFSGTLLKEDRTRTLLVKKQEIIKLKQEILTKKVALIPLSIFQEKNKIKVMIGICKHKKAHERKEDIKEKDIKRETRRELKGKFTY